MRQAGIEVPDPPSAAVSAMPALRAAFMHAGLTQVETRSIIAERTLQNFEAYWTAALLVGGLGGIMAKLSADMVEEVRALTRGPTARRYSGRGRCDRHRQCDQGHRADIGPERRSAMVPPRAAR